MEFRMVVVAFVAIYIVQDAKTTTSDAKPPAIIDEPGEGFRGDVPSCLVCHPIMPMCGNRVDCCVEANNDHIQACPKSPHTVCYKTEVYDGTFFNVTRGCGKRHAHHAVSQTDDECVTFGDEGLNVVCNCNKLNCNSSTQNTLSLALVSVPLAYFLKSLL